MFRVPVTVGLFIHVASVDVSVYIIDFVSVCPYLPLIVFPCVPVVCVSVRTVDRASVCPCSLLATLMVSVYPRSPCVPVIRVCR